MREKLKKDKMETQKERVWSCQEKKIGSTAVGSGSHMFDMSQKI